jgi:hypothetical protein
MAGMGGAPVGESVLTLRLMLAIFGLVFCSGAAVGAWIPGRKRRHGPGPR